MFKLFLKQLDSNKSTQQAAAMAFYLAICMVPLCLLILTMVMLFGLNDKISITEQMHNILSPVVINIIEILYQDKSIVLKDSYLSTVISSTILLFSSSLFFNQIKQSLSIIFKVSIKSPKLIIHIIKQRFLSILLTIIFLATVTASLVISLLFKNLAFEQNMSFKWIQSIGSFITFFFLFFIVYKVTLRSYVPNIQQLIGAFFTALIIQFGQHIFTLYLSLVPLKSIYGPISLFIGFLLWSYVFSLSVVLCAEAVFFYFKPQKA